MKIPLFYHIKKRFATKAFVLMYHRIAAPESDVWEIAVSPERFEQQLKVLRNMMNIVPLQQLISSQNFNKNNVAITFDDGYIDNFKIAMPLLEKYRIPATFFITSRQVQNEDEFWWDKLERYILFAENLPPVFKLNNGGNEIVIELKEEIYLTEEIRYKHSLWKACTAQPPTLRAILFLKLWQQLQVLPPAEQNQYLNKIRNWANLPDEVRTDYKTMSALELKQLAANGLFTIGAHTANHSALAFHNAKFQKSEIQENREYLRKISGQEINFLAYPYGNYNGETLLLAQELGFQAAFTTEEKTLAASSIYKLGRFQVKNLTGKEFRNQLKRWRIS